MYFVWIKHIWRFHPTKNIYTKIFCSDWTGESQLSLWLSSPTIKTSRHIADLTVEPTNVHDKVLTEEGFRTRRSQRKFVLKCSPLFYLFLCLWYYVNSYVNVILKDEIKCLIASYCWICRHHSSQPKLMLLRVPQLCDYTSGRHTSALHNANAGGDSN